MAQRPLAEFYRSSLRALGVFVEPEHAWDDAVPSSLPVALLAWYRVAGRHPVNDAHNRILLPNELEHRSGKLVFADENQQVVIWGIDDADRDHDPEVWQGQPALGGWDSGVEWYSEELVWSRFIIAMIRFAIVGEEAGP